MGVIEFKRPKYSIYFFYDRGENVVRRWFDEVSEVAWSAFCAVLDIYEVGGFGTIQACAIDLDDGFWGLKIPQQTGAIPCPIFLLGPFDEETEITFLVGAKWDEKQNCVRPYSAVGAAKENLDLLSDDQTRRRKWLSID